MKKIGEITSGQVVIVLLTIISFVMLVWFLLTYPFSDTVDRETCHQSIVMRSSVNNWLVKTNQIVPLKCQTEKMCLSISGESCEKEFLKPNKNNIIYRKTVPGGGKETLDRIKDEYAKALYDCHSMVGEGQLSFMPNSFYEKKYCLICSRIAAGNDLKNKSRIGGGGESIQISYIDLYEYMKDMKTPDGRSYLQATFDAETVGEMTQRLEKVREVYNKNSEIKIEKIEDMKINLSGQNAIIVQTIPKSTWKTWVVAGGSGAAIATGIILAPFTFGGSLSLTAVGVAIAAGGGATAVIYVKNAPDGSGYVEPAIFPYDLQRLRDIGCTSFETAP